MVRRRVAVAVDMEHVATTLAGGWTDIATLVGALALPATPQLACRVDETRVSVAYDTGAPARADAMHRSLRGKLVELRGAPQVLAGPGAIVRWLDGARVLELSRRGSTVALAVVPNQDDAVWSIAIDSPGDAAEHGAPVAWELFARTFASLVPSLVADVGLLADLVTCVVLALESETGSCSLHVAPPQVALVLGDRRWTLQAPDDAAIARLAPRMLDAIAGGPTTEGLAYRFHVTAAELAPPEAESPPRDEADDELWPDAAPSTDVDAHLDYEPDEVDPEDEELHAEPDAYAGLHAADLGDVAIVASDAPDVDDGEDDDEDDDDGDDDPDRVDPARISEAPPPEDAPPPPVVRPIAAGRRGILRIGVRPR